MRAKNRLKNQSGTALVVALVMIVVLTFIGLTSMFTATFETSLSGNKRLSTDSFYNAETRTTTAAKAAPAVDDQSRDDPASSPFTVTKLADDSGLSDAEKNSGLKDQRINRKTTIPPDKLHLLALPSGQTLNDKSTVTIYHTPAGTGSSRATMQSDAYIIDTVGTDQVVSGNKSKIQIRMKVVSHRPSAEDSM
jgi:Tfp pilus assembly protein PilX